MLDHETMNQELGELQKSYALEVSYRRQLNKWLGLAVPFRAGNLDVGEFRNPGFISLDLLARVTPLGSDSAFSPFLQAGYGLVSEGERDTYGQIPLAVGGDFRLGPDMWLSVQGEYRISDTELRNNLTASVGYVYRFGGRRGVARHPNTATGTRPAGKERPDKPKKVPDTDRDGVRDDVDRCPDEKGGKETGGCPDYDKDGLADIDDQCPYEAGKKRLRGCPDIDNDGVPDDLDKCPNDAGSLTTGCPDTDGDGYEDDVDECPDVAGPNRGCPEIGQNVRERLAEATSATRFESRSDKLLSDSYPILDQIVGIMRDFPNYQLLIEGHTDNVGTDENNLVLSELRALSTRGYLVSKGIEPGRIRVIGYGASRPRADNNTLVGRGLNRRVEFIMTPKQP